jgi:integrase/recombinase XerD
MLEGQHLHPTTIRRRLSALSSLFTHLVRYGMVAQNPVQAVKRPAINRWEGLTPAFTPQHSRALLDAPDSSTIQGLRDGAMLSVGLQVSIRRSGIIRLKVRDLQTTRSCDALRIIRKGGKRDIMAVHPETAQRLRAYLEAAGHANDREGTLFGPVSAGRAPQPIRRQLCPDGVDDTVEKYINQLGLGKGYSPHSMRATFVTTALENGAKLEGVQHTVGHADPSTTQLNDRRRFLPTKSAGLMVAD